ncbi:MAG: S8 family serine peptidase [Candidatus Moraniibacteriota bacterium]
MKKHKKILLIFIGVIFLILSFNNASAENICENPVYKNNDILVKFKKKNISENYLNNFANLYNLKYSPEENKLDRKGYFLFQSDSSESLQDKIKELKKDKPVKNAQPNYIFQTAKKKKKSKSSQDQYFNREWWILNEGKYGVAGADLWLMGVWRQEQAVWPGVVIGVIDTGVSRTHADLKKNIVTGYDFVHGKSEMADKDGHGSFIAGLIASQVNNRKGIAGLSRLDRLKIMPLKFDFSTDEAITAMAYAQTRGVRILNMSWGTNEFDQALYDAIQSYSGLVTAAAGNEGTEHADENHFYPCDFDLLNVICVGASNENDQIAYYSDYGENVDLLAPGGTEEMPLISLDIKTNRYTEGLGTSFSTAFASGAAGLVLSANPSMSNQEIVDSIIQNVRKKDELTGIVSSGGILNIKAAVNRENTVNSNP